MGCCAVGPFEAQTLLFDDFENGVGGDTVWSPWGNVSGDSHTPNGYNNLVTTDTNHALSGTHSARAWEADPAHWNGYADFGATSAGLKATVHLYDDMNYVPPYLDQPSGSNRTSKFAPCFRCLEITRRIPWRLDRNTDYLEIRTYSGLGSRLPGPE